jgi:protein translocase SecG subunit
MRIFVFIIHFFVTILLVGGTLVQTSKADGGSLFGGGGDVFRGATKGFEGFIEKWMLYLAYAFLATSFLSAIIMPKYF